MIFNDENQDEKGGLSASTQGVSISFDYVNAEAVALDTEYDNEQKIGAVELAMRQMPDPDIPIDQVTAADAPLRVLLGTDNIGDGALLWLCDSAGRPRITLQVDADDVPRIQILDAGGGVVAQLPPDAPAAAPTRRGRLGRMRQPGLVTRTD